MLLKIVIFSHLSLPHSVDVGLKEVIYSNTRVLYGSVAQMTGCSLTLENDNSESTDSSEGLHWSVNTS